MTDSASNRILQLLGHVPEPAPQPVVQSVVIGFGHRARSGKDTVAQMIKQYRGITDPADFEVGAFDLRAPTYDIRIYSFAGELKREVNENAEKSGGMIRLFDNGLRMEGAGYWQTNGNILPLPEWVQYDPNAPMDDPLCPYGKQRALLMWWGTEFRRSINPDYWVQKLAKRQIGRAHV